jgi:hypothetical protein
MTSGKDKRTIVSMSGGPILQHGPAAPRQVPRGEMSLEEISNHIEAHLGKVDFVFHELVSDTVHIDIHIVKPQKSFPFVRLVTSGMSDLPMTIPEDASVPRFAEVMVTLPATWALDQESFQDERWYWPVRLLKELARLPHKHGTWLGFGHTVPNGDPSEPYAANTKLCGALILPSVTVPDEFHTLRIDEAKEITFFSVVPLYADEMALKLREGVDELLDKFDSAELTDVIDPLRRSVLKKRFGIL